VERTPAKVGLSIVQEEDNIIAGPVTTLPDPSNKNHSLPCQKNGFPKHAGLNGVDNSSGCARLAVVLARARIGRSLGLFQRRVP
jgi:hypothetical protein